MARPPALQGIGVGMIFGQGSLSVRALHPTDVAVSRGELLVIIGPSGSGKTTLLSILGLILSPTEGGVSIEGRPVAAASADELAVLRRDTIGFVFQQFNLIAGLTAAENVGLPLRLAGRATGERERRARRALDTVGIGDKHAVAARWLSGGEQQRVAIARAIVADAAVLLCDEPTASLDGATGREVLGTLQRLAREAHRAVVIVTHDERVLEVADRVMLVEDGRGAEVALAQARAGRLHHV